MNDNKNKPGGDTNPRRKADGPAGVPPRGGYADGSHGRPAIRRVRRRSFAGPVIAALIMTVIVVVAIAALVMLLTGKLDPYGGVTGAPDTSSAPDSDTSGPADTDGAAADTQTGTEPAVTAPAETQGQTQTAAGYKTISVDNAGVHAGDLILVNYQNEYVFPDKKNTVTIYGNKNSSYKLSTSQLEVTGKTLDALNAMMLAYAAQSNNYDVFVKTAYRSLADQKSLYNARVESFGEENAKKYLAQPGYSEHHTGMCFDLGIYSDEGKAYELDGLSGYSDWFVDNCAKYGFVRRFPEDKSAVTGVTGETWHFRYIGQVHAETMNALDLCLEEYIEKLREYTYNGGHLLVTASTGAKYGIYYQYASITETTDISVPENLPYEISGDNSQGFVITVALQA